MEEPSTESRQLAWLTLVASLAGIIVGLVGGLFQILLEKGAAYWLHAISFLRSQETPFGLYGLLIVMIASALCVALARLLTRFDPNAAGSGIQHVEAVMYGQAQPASLKVLPIKFVGGLLAMIPGLALGREGPTVQMAAVIGTQCAKWLGLNKADRFLLYTAVAGSGLSVAFNAPVAGAAFVIEEVSKVVTLRRAVVTLAAIASSMIVYRLIYGNHTSFNVHVISNTTLLEFGLYALLGMSTGLLAVLYNRTIMATADAVKDRHTAIPIEAKAAVIGAFLGALAWFAPLWVGAGEAQTIALLSQPSRLACVLSLFIIRWIVGPLSYATGAPGGLFAPMLLLGACAGVLFACALQFLPFMPALNVTHFAMVAMASFFVGSVRAPVTGVILITEMTGSTELIVPLLVAVLFSTVSATLTGNPPIYDSLRERLQAVKASSSLM
jgi:CIC family chloride channel protein